MTIYSASINARVEYVVKTDDDMYVNLVNLREIVDGNNNNNNLLMGSLFTGSAPIKDPVNKW